MERRDFFALLLGAIAAPLLKKRVKATPTVSRITQVSDLFAEVTREVQIPSGFVTQWYGFSAPEGWVIIPDNAHMHSVVDPGHSHSPPVLIQKL